MRTIAGLLVAASIFIVIPILTFAYLFDKGVMLIGAAIEATGLALDEKGVFLVFGGYVLAFFSVMFALTLCCAKLALNWWGRRLPEN